MWLFHLHSAVKIQPFSPVFPLAGTTVKAFFRLSLWSFKEKASTIFYNTAIKKENRDSLAQQAAPVFRIGAEEGLPPASLLSAIENRRKFPDRRPVTAADPGLRPPRRVDGRAERFGREGCQKAIRTEELQPRGANVPLVSPPGSTKPGLRKRTAY